MDGEGGDGQLGRYPDAYQGYRNFALAFNLALAKVRGTVLDTDSPALLGKDETFVSTFSPQFHDFIERLTGLMTDLPPAQLERLQPYPMTYWNPDGLRSILREGRQRAHTVDSATPEAVSDPTVIFVNAVMLDEHLPQALKTAHDGHTHQPGAFDDNAIIRELNWAVTNRGVTYVKKLKPPHA